MTARRLLWITGGGDGGPVTDGALRPFGEGPGFGCASEQRRPSARAKRRCLAPRAWQDCPFAI